LRAKIVSDISELNSAEGLRDFGIAPDEIYFKSRQKHKGGSKGVILLLGGCGTGIPIGRFGKTFCMTGQGVGYAVRRGERFAKANNYRLTD
jgi:aspartate/methionine/tyrosine aminotransferase